MGGEAALQQELYIESLMFCIWMTKFGVSASLIFGICHRFCPTPFFRYTGIECQVKPTRRKISRASDRSIFDKRPCGEGLPSLQSGDKSSKFERRVRHGFLATFDSITHFQPGFFSCFLPPSIRTGSQRCMILRCMILRVFLFKFVCLVIPENIHFFQHDGQTAFKSSSFHEFVTTDY